MSDSQQEHGPPQQYGPPGQPPGTPPGQPPYGPAGQPPYGPPGQPPYGAPEQPSYGPPGQPPYAQPGPNPYAALPEQPQQNFQLPPGVPPPPSVPPAVPPQYGPPGHPQPGPYGMPPAPRRKTAAVVLWTLVACLVVAGGVVGVLMATDGDDGKGTSGGGTSTSTDQYELTVPTDLEGGELFLDENLTESVKKEYASVEDAVGARYGADVIGTGEVVYRGLRDDEEFDAKAFLADLPGAGTVKAEPREIKPGSAEETFLCQVGTATREGTPVSQSTCVWAQGTMLVSFTLTEMSAYAKEAELDTFADRCVLMLHEVRPEKV